MVNQVGILKLIVLLVEICKAYPYFRSFARAFLRVYCLDGFSKCLDCQVGVLFTQLDATKPLVNIVWVLTQDDIRKQKWASLNQVLQSDEFKFIFLFLGELFEFARVVLVFNLLVLIVTFLISKSPIEKCIDLIG